MVSAARLLLLLLLLHVFFAASSIFPSLSVLTFLTLVRVLLLLKKSSYSRVSSCTCRCWWMRRESQKNPGHFPTFSVLFLASFPNFPQLVCESVLFFLPFASPLQIQLDVDQSCCFFPALGPHESLPESIREPLACVPCLPSPPLLHIMGEAN